MKQYKYALDKSSKKFTCPKCHKKTYVKYTETETGNYLDEDFGRCDRESNCNYHSAPNGDYKNTFEVINIPKPEPSFHDLELVDKSMNDYLNNNFIQFLKTIFANEEVKKVTNKYLIGTSKFWNGATVFWQIDNKELVHAGKVLRYVSETGKRYKTKDGKSLINWVHSILKLNDFILSQCLFGLHLINEINQKTVAIVESEKTAIIMSLFKPEYVWLATGGKGFLKYNMLLPIKQFKIVAFPDKGEYKDWLNKATDLNGFGFKIEVNDWLENSNYENGTDLADVYISSLNTETEIN